tara:strand:+ start:676 stop:1482 length:807 start_codon:yes stop_codon:yes gene_type:complete
MAEEGQQAEEQPQENTTEEQPQEENRGLLSKSEAAPVTEEEAQQEMEHQAQDSATEDDDWEYPEDFPEQFKGKDGLPDMEGLVKGYNDFRKIVSQGKHKVPKDGKYALDVLGEGANEEPLTDVLVNFAKNTGLSQQQFDSLVTDLGGAIAEMNPTSEINLDEELQSLGNNGQQIVNSMANWGQGLVNKGVFSKEDYEEFELAGATAGGIRMLKKIREAYEGRVPTESMPMEEGAASDEELHAMVADPKYQTDIGYRKKVEKLFNQRYN